MAQGCQSNTSANSAEPLATFRRKNDLAKLSAPTAAREHDRVRSQASHLVTDSPVALMTFSMFGFNTTALEKSALEPFVSPSFFFKTPRLM
jgi:hypothetical protein